MDKTFELIKQAKELLQSVTGRFGIVPIGMIIKIQEIIKELEDILEENE